MIPGEDIHEGDEVEVCSGSVTLGWVPGTVVRRHVALGAVVRYSWAVRLSNGKVGFFGQDHIRKVDE